MSIQFGGGGVDSMFSSMTTPPAHTTLPPVSSYPTTYQPGSSHTPTNGNSPGHSNPGQSGPKASRTGSQTGSHPSNTGTGGKGGPGGGNTTGSSESNKTAIAIGTVFSVPGFATGVAFVVWYLHRRRARSGHAFDPHSDDEEESLHSITAVHRLFAREGATDPCSAPWTPWHDWPWSLTTTHESFATGHPRR